MLLTQVPRQTAKPQPAATFDQCLQNRLAELGIDDAELFRRYSEHVGAKLNRRRSSALKVLRGETDPTLATVFDLLHPEVLDGKLMIDWGAAKGIVLSDPEATASALRSRVVDVGLDPDKASDIAAVTRRYLVARFGKHNLDPWPYKKTIRRMVQPGHNPQLETLIDVAQGLGGRVLVQWLVTVRERLSAKQVPKKLEGRVVSKPVILEYQVLSAPQVLITRPEMD